MYREYEIKSCRGFYGIFCYGKLIQTADTLHEAERDLEEIENENQTDQEAKSIAS